LSFGSSGKEKKMPDVRNDDAMAELYAKDAGFAVQVLNDVLENGEPGELLITLRQFTKAFGGVQAVAEKAELNPTQLYRTLSAEGNPTLHTFRAVLKAMGLQLRVERIATESAEAQAFTPAAEVSEAARP
jgi:probable addiction module antidote protein